jgi:hypothetical protein
MDSYDVHVHPIQFQLYDTESFWTFNIIKNIFKYMLIVLLGVVQFHKIWKKVSLVIGDSVMMRGRCSFCCYWWHWWPSLFKLSFLIYVLLRTKYMLWYLFICLQIIIISYSQYVCGFFVVTVRVLLNLSYHMFNLDLGIPLGKPNLWMFNNGI